MRFARSEPMSVLLPADCRPSFQSAPRRRCRKYIADQGEVSAQRMLPALAASATTCPAQLLCAMWKAALCHGGVQIHNLSHSGWPRGAALRWRALQLKLSAIGRTRTATFDSCLQYRRSVDVKLPTPAYPGCRKTNIP